MVRRGESSWLPDWLPGSVRGEGSRSTLSAEQLRIALLIGSAMVAAAVALLSQATGALNAPEHQTVDTRFSIRGAEKPDPRIVIVALDPATLNRLNVQSPIPRKYYAQLLDQLHQDKASLIVLDSQFKGVSPRPDQDRELLAAIARDGPVLMGAPDPGSSTFRPVGAQHAPGAVLASLGVDNHPDVVIRQILYKQVALKTLSVRAAELITGKPVSTSNFPNNHAWIDFRGPPGIFRQYSLWKVLHSQTPASALAGKIVLVGTTDPLAKDVFITAAASDPMAGVELQANELSTILDGFPLRPTSDFVNVLLIFALASLPALLSVRFASLQVLAAALATLGLYLVAVQLAFNSGRIMPLLNPLLALILATAAVIAVETYVERRRRQALEFALRGFVRPAQTGFFISYRRNQAAFAANSLREQLVRRFGESSVFKDTHAIHAGQEWPREIREAILGASVMLILIGPYWLDARDSNGQRRLDDPRDWVRLEIEAGLKRPELAMVPVLLDGADVPDEKELPVSLAPLARRNAISLSGDRLGEEIDELVDSIERGRIRELLAAPRSAPVLCLLAAGGPRRFPISSELVIGSGADADIRIADDGVAARQAKVWPVPEGLAVEDLGAGDGTWVNGARIHGTLRIASPSAIRLGHSTLVVELGRPTHGTATPSGEPVPVV